MPFPSCLRKRVRSAILFAAGVLLFAGCTASPDRSAENAPPDPTDTTVSATPPVQEDTTGAPALRSEEDARRVLRAVYHPIHAFYQRMENPERGHTRPPEGMATPDALVDTLTQTMAPDLARSFTEQLLMQRGGRYIVRPTEKILIPYGRPALETVSIERQGDAYVLTERYAKTQLNGRVERKNVVRWQNGRWRLVDIRQ